MARGTELSARIESYRALLDSTNGMLTAPLRDQHFISAADLGTDREMAMRNRTKQHVRTEKKDARRRHKQEMRRVGGGGSVAEEIGGRLENETGAGLEEEEEDFFCDAPRKYAWFGFL